MQSETLTQRLGRSSIQRILRELVTNSGLFPLFDAMRFISERGVVAYLTELTHYAIFIAAIAQAWFLGRRSDYPAWQRAAGNLIGVVLYTLLDFIIDGPADFFRQPYHWLFWAYALGMALFYLIESGMPRLRTLGIMLISLWRVMLFPTLYYLSELGGELKALTEVHLEQYWNSSTGHIFITLAAVLFGLMLGLSEIEVARYTGFLRKVARRFKEVSEWSIDSDLLEESLEDSGALQQRRAERTVLFMDIRGFTAWSENRQPEVVVGMLNQYYEVAEKVITEGGGRKPHFIADAVMAWFDEPQDAASTARKLSRQSADLLSKDQLASGIGLHTGEVVEGLMGSSTTRSYNIIGDTVNTASRLCSAAAGGEVLISETLATRIALDVTGRPAQELQVKGKQEPVRVYQL
jgi:class 3 adenylate cyclase